MVVKITSKKAKIVELVFLSILILFIIISCFKPIQAGEGQIGIKALPLDIGDRRFYIEDEEPFANRNIDGFGGPLYPNVLKGISFISIKLFKQDSISYFWNTLAITFSSILSFLNIRLAYGAGKLFCDESTGIMTMAFFTICPYTYFYALSAGITIYTLFGATLATYLILKIFKKNDKFNNPKNKLILHIFLSLVLIYMSYLRPSSIIFCEIVSGLIILLQIKNLLLNNQKKYSAFIIFIFIVPLIIGINEFWETKFYSIKALDAFSKEQGTFLGYERDLIRNKIEVLMQSSKLVNNIEGLTYNFLWKINDFLSGIIDIRDTHNPAETSLLSFLIRVSVGTFLLGPTTYIFLVGLFVFRKIILNSGLWVSLTACIISISPSLIGVAMSRYYYMFITPFILVAAMTISKIYKSKILMHHDS